MKPRQLANVLITILGLSVCVHGVPALIAAMIAGLSLLIQAMQDGQHASTPGFPYWNYSMTYFIQSLIEFAVGIYLIVRSRWLTERLVKDE